MPLPLLKSCLVLVGSDCGKARLSKRLSNSAAKPKSHFPHRPAPGFSRQLGQARGNPDLIRAVHAPSPALVCLSLLEMSGKFFQAISVHPGVLAGLGAKYGMGALAAGERASRSRLRRLTRPLAAPHLARESGLLAPSSRQLYSDRATLPLALSWPRPPLPNTTADPSCL